MKSNSSRGFAIAYRWDSGAHRSSWYNGLHDSWRGWIEVTASHDYSNNTLTIRT